MASVATNQFVLSVNPGVPVKTCPEFVEYARKAKPPLPLRPAATAASTPRHGDAEAARRHRHAARAVSGRRRRPCTATVAGETKVLFAGAASAPLIQSGAVARACHQRRSARQAFPNVPTVGEIYPGYDGRHLARPVRAGRHAGADRRPAAHRNAEVLARPEFAAEAQRLRSLEPLILSPADSPRLIHSDYEKYGKLIREIGIKLD